MKPKLEIKLPHTWTWRNAILRPIAGIALVGSALKSFHWIDASVFASAIAMVVVAAAVVVSLIAGIAMLSDFLIDIGEEARDRTMRK